MGTKGRNGSLVVAQNAFQVRFKLRRCIRVDLNVVSSVERHDSLLIAHVMSSVFDRVDENVRSSFLDEQRSVNRDPRLFAVQEIDRDAFVHLMNSVYHGF